MSAEDWELERLLEDIWRQCSIGVREKEPIYVKHFGFLTQREIDRLRQTIFESAKASGLPTQKEALDFLQEEGLWTHEDSLALTTKRDFIAKLESTHGSLLLAAQKKQVGAQLEGERKELLKLEGQKLALLRDTCESYAQKKINHEMLFFSFYKDIDLKERYLSRGEFEEMEKPQLWELTEVYNDITAHLSLENIKRLALYPAFVNYYNVVEEQPEGFFDGSVLHWTFYQVNLINYAKIFKNILNNIPDIPEHVKEDAELLLDFAQGDNRRRQMAERSSQADSYSVMGATSQDMANLDLNAQGGKTLGEHIKEKGGKMGMEDFADLFGK